MSFAEGGPKGVGAANPQCLSIWYFARHVRFHGTYARKDMARFVKMLRLFVQIPKQRIFNPKTQKSLFQHLGFRV